VFLSQTGTVRFVISR